MTSTPAPDDDPHPSDGTLKEYIGTIWIGDEPGRHLIVWARTGGEARDKVVAEYGEGHVITLHNEADAPKPTSHGRIHRVLHYEVVIPHPPLKSELPPGILAEVERDWHDFPNLPGEPLVLAEGRSRLLGAHYRLQWCGKRQTRKQDPVPITESHISFTRFLHIYFTRANLWVAAGR